MAFNHGKQTTHPITVIITTAPVREDHLYFCLRALQQQTFQDFHIVVVDDGSDQNWQIARQFQDSLDITYDWRPTDHNPGRSRNRGAKLSHSDTLIFVDGDVILNQYALAFYSHYSQHLPQALLHGYCGYIPDILSTASIWYPERLVQWFDNRFIFRCCAPILPPEEKIHVMAQKQRMIVPTELLKYPHIHAGSRNFCVQRILYEQIGGFDESFECWGYEDIAFARQASQIGISHHFILDAWGEHQWHSVQTQFKSEDKLQRNIRYYRQLQKLTPLPPMQDSVRIHATSQTLDSLEKAFTHWYMPQLTHKKRRELPPFEKDSD